MLVFWRRHVKAVGEDLDILDEIKRLSYWNNKSAAVESEEVCQEGSVHAEEKL